MIGAVVPTRNEQDSIETLVSHLLLICDEVFVADDSDDMTSMVALSAGAHVVDPPPGIGPAYLEAWKKIPDDWHVVHVDAGGSHPIESVQRVVRAAPTADLIVGSRFMSGGSHAGSVARSFTSRMAAAALNLVTPCRYTDWTSGLRSYSPRARAYLASLDYETTGHAWQLESLYRASEHGFTVREVPINYTMGRSSLSGPRVEEAFKYWWSLAWS